MIDDVSEEGEMAIKWREEKALRTKLEAELNELKQEIETIRSNEQQVEEQKKLKKELDELRAKLENSEKIRV
jgi:regulator of replication initiation timing